VATRQRPQELVVRRTGGSAKATCAHVGSRCVGRGVRRNPTASWTHEAGCSPRRHLWRTAAGSVFTRVKKGGGFYGRLEAVEAFLARQGCGGRRMGRLHGQGTTRCGRRRATASEPMEERRCTGQRLRGERVAPAYCPRPRHLPGAQWPVQPLVGFCSGERLGVFAVVLCCSCFEFGSVWRSVGLFGDLGAFRLRPVWPVCCTGLTCVKPLSGSCQLWSAGTVLTDGAHRSDRCWSVDSRFGVPLRSRVGRLCVGS
jgi:hypothetical protein